MALHEHGAARRVDAERQVLRGRHQCAAAQGLGILRHGDGVLVDDAEERLVTVLQLRPVRDGTQGIAEVQGVGGGLGAREYDLFASATHDLLIFALTSSGLFRGQLL